MILLWSSQQDQLFLTGVLQKDLICRLRDDYGSKRLVPCFNGVTLVMDFLMAEGIAITLRTPVLVTCLLV